MSLIKVSPYYGVWTLPHIFDREDYKDLTMLEERIVKPTHFCVVLFIPELLLRKIF